MKRYLFLVIMLFGIGVTKVNATPIDDECVENETCELLCNYVTRYTFGGSNNTGYQSQTRSRNLTIYYNYENGNIFLKWQSTNSDADVYTKGPNTFNKIFSTSGTNVFWGIDERPTIENFVCPENGYLDTDGINGNNELCFDNDGTSCKDKHSGWATSFGKNGGFISVEKDYDFEDQIAAYKDWVFGDIKEDISNGTFNPEEDIAEKIVNDFETNFLSGNQAPTFMINSDEFQDIFASIEGEYEKAKEEVRDEVEAAVAAGEMTAEEAESILSRWESYDTEKISENAQNAMDTIIGNSLDFSGDEHECDTYLGSGAPGTPMYYIEFALNLIKYIAIVMLFVFTIIEFAKAVAASDEKAIKKAATNTIKRLVIVVIIFFAPTLITFIFRLLGIASDPSCGL